MNPWQKRAAVAELEENGVSVTLPDYPEWTFMVLPITPWARRYHRAVARASEQPEVAAYLKRTVEPDYQTQDGDAALDRRILTDAFAEGALKSWSGVTDEAGKPMQYSLGNARRLLQHFPDIFDALNAAARRKPVAPTVATKKATAKGN